MLTDRTACSRGRFTVAVPAKRPLTTGNAPPALTSSMWAVGHWRQTLPPPWKRLRWCAVRRAR